MSTSTSSPALRLHHHAVVVADQEATRHFYEDILGMPLIATWCEVENVRGKERTYCHTFFELADGSSMAFFQFLDPEDGAELSLDTGASLNHVALNSTRAQQAGVKERLEASGFPYRTVDHGYCFSLYVSDPDGQVLEVYEDGNQRFVGHELVDPCGAVEPCAASMAAWALEPAISCAAIR